MGRRSIVLLATFAFGSVAIASPQQAPTFRGGVTLVRVDVTVLDHDGKPVPGLIADDFEVKLDGKVRPVRTVAYEEAPRATHPAPMPATTPSDASREFTNAAPAADPRLFVLLVDDLAIPATRDKALFFSASRFVDSLPSTDVVGFTTSSGSVSVNPSRDRGAVEAGLRRVSGSLVDMRQTPPSDLPVGLDEAVEAYEGDRQMMGAIGRRDCDPLMAKSSGHDPRTCADDVDRKVREMAKLVEDMTERQELAYLSLINALKQAPGQKFLVILTDGLVVSDRGHTGAVALEPIGRAAAAAGVQVSVLFAAPDEGGVTMRSPAEGEMLRSDGIRLMQSTQTLADVTGGNFWRVMGQPERFFSFLTLATSGVYHLGVEAPAGAPATHDFALGAHVKRSGLTVHANRVAMLPAAEPALPVDTQLQNAVVKGGPNFGVPLTLATVLRRGNSPDTIDVGANLEVPASTPGPLTVMFGLLDATGHVRTGRRTLDAPPGGASYRVSVSLPTAPGKYRLRLAVADANGRIGSVDAPLTAELEHVGPFLASSGPTASSDADNVPQFLALEAVPPTATTLHMFVELYQASDTQPPDDVRVEWLVTGEGARTVADQTVTAVSGADRLTAECAVPLAALPVGTYEIKGTGLVAGQPVGAVSTSVRKR